ncbi:hypothetical protein [Desulfobacter sp.]|uniref:hypothetical protein n=1 Tax=Desulfobacter sp. TaxID=2294 RepID=UPI003D13FDAD
MVQLRQKVKDASPSFYLTLISIIASLAFGYLLSKIKDEYLYGSDWRRFLYWLKVLLSFQAIIITWHEYAMSTVAFKWVLNYVDSLVPFLFGITLFGIIENLACERTHVWFYFLSGFTLIAIVAYNNQFLKTEREDENGQILSIMRLYHPMCIFSSIICTMFFPVFGIMSFKFGQIELVSLSLCAVTNLIFIVYTIRCDFCWKSAFKQNPYLQLEIEPQQ